MWPSLKNFRRPPPRLPNGIRVYAVGDIHGRIDLLDQTLAKIDSDLARSAGHRSIQIFLGDYIDRGPSSCEVVERLIARARSCEVQLLKGNHEAFALSFMRDPRVLSEWRQFGGLETLLSYGLKPRLNPLPGESAELALAWQRLLPISHREFLQTLQSSYSCGDFFFVHAGVKPGIPLTEQHEEDLLWIREDFLLHDGNFGKVVVHGHTPVAEPDFHGNRINIDTGAYATGRLTCLRLEGQTMSLL